MGEEHSARQEAGGIGTPIIERKIKLDGSVREYPCRLIHRESGLAVVEFVMAHGGAIYGTPIEVPPGSVSHGYFWTARPYDLYRMRRPDGSLLAHRFDAVADVVVERGIVSYRDLVLDWWVTADDTLIEEDRDEFDAAVASGLLGPDDARRAREAALQVHSRYRHIIDGATTIERRFRAV